MPNGNEESVLADFLQTQQKKPTEPECNPVQWAYVRYQILLTLRLRILNPALGRKLAA